MEEGRRLSAMAKKLEARKKTHMEGGETRLALIQPRSSVALGYS